MIGVSEIPKTVYLVGWTDVLDEARQAIAISGHGISAIRAVDPNAQIRKGAVAWDATPLWRCVYENTQGRTTLHEGKPGTNACDPAYAIHGRCGWVVVIDVEGSDAEG